MLINIDKDKSQYINKIVNEIIPIDVYHFVLYHKYTNKFHIILYHNFLHNSNYTNNPNNKLFHKYVLYNRYNLLYKIIHYHPFDKFNNKQCDK